MLVAFFAIVGGVFSCLAALIAFLITYNELKKHEFSGWQLWQESLRTGFLAFVIFFVLCLSLAVLLPRIV
jgi:hypothetical protein